MIGKWYFLFPQIGLTAFLFFTTSIIFTFSPPDYYGANKEIPKDVRISEPLNKKPDQEQFHKYDLVVAHSVQPGIYSYHTDYQPTKTGYFYIKAYEITSGDRLSANRMTERSKIEVKTLKQKKYSGEFKIYEGSWGDKYGSRIELWFQPSSKNEEYKIEERNFIVEGWMR